MDPLPRASVVIASRNRPRMLRETIGSILSGEKLPAEIVVVDQSDVPDPEVASLGDGRCPITYVLSTARGLSVARNEAARRAASEVLVFADDDMYATPTWLGSLLRAFAEAGERSVVTGRVTAGEPEIAHAPVPAHVARDTPAVYQGRLDTDVLAGGNIAISRAALEEVGGWDERMGPGGRFPAAEDNDLGLRLLANGYRIVYAPEAELVHRAWRSRGGGLALRWQYGRGKGGFYGKHRLGHRLAADLGKRVRRLPRRLARQRGLAAADALYSLGIVAGTLHWALTEGLRRDR